MILSSFLFGYSCSQIARNKGRHPGYWFLIGLLFGLLALLAIALLPPPGRASTLFRQRAQRPPPVTKIPKLATIDPAQAHPIWYYLDREKTQLGPMSFDALTRDWREGKVTDRTWVWNERLENWKPLNEVLQAE